MVDRLLLIACALIILATLFYFFYWNRLIAWVLGFGFRLLYWNKGGSSIWLEIGSIHFSILTGRILFKDVRYHSSNQTLQITKGEVVWRYWIRRPTKEDEIGLNLGKDEKVLNHSLSCRIQVSLQGYQWFLYNRTAAYDNIIAQMQASTDESTTTQSHSFHESFLHSSYIPALLARPPRIRIPSAIQNIFVWIRGQLPNLDPKDLLPLGLVVTKGAIICGNSSTPNLLVVEFQRTQGTFGIVQSRSKHDLYKQVLTLGFEDAIIRYADNGDYLDPITVVGEKASDRMAQYSSDPISTYLSFGPFAKFWRKFKLAGLVTKPKSDAKPRRKSADDETPIGADFTTLEYAIERKILDAPLFELCYYTDIVGDVPPLPHPTGTNDSIGNGDAGPEWGVDIIIHRGSLRFGPWADRQRAELQKIFFPPTFQNARETARLRPGDKRVWTALRVFIELRDQTNLRIPFREASKNWQWDGLQRNVHRPSKRESASIHLTAGDRSSISYVMPMVASSTGYGSVLEVHLDAIAVTSSLNDIRLVSAESFRVRCDLPAPLVWNEERIWTIALSFRQPILYLLRDHINMFTDLGKDWASGPPSDHHRFVPTLYAIELDLHHFELNLNANDHNIIDKPLISDENALFTLSGPRLKNTTTIPSNTYRPESTAITFSLEMPNVSLNLSLPRWNVYALHLPKEGNSLAKVETIRIDGSYRYYSEVRKDYVEQLDLSFAASGISFKLLGWSIRYLMILRDNYLGSFTQFSTLYEYLEKRRKGLPQGDPVMQKYRPGKANMMQVQMSVDVQNGIIVMPVGLPGYEHSCTRPELGIGPGLVLALPELQLQFRMHDYYMEMTLNVDTISGWIEPNCPEKVGLISQRNMPKEILIIDGLDITANRLFGPAPRTLTYVCIWEIHLGDIKGILAAQDATLIAAAGQAFRINFADPLNGPAAEYLPPLYPDLTFVKVTVSAIDLTWAPGHATLVISVPHGLKVDNNDLGGQFHRKLTSLRLPEVSVKILATSESKQSSWLEAASFSGDAFLDIYSSPAGGLEEAEDQAAFVEEQDQLTGRARKMFGALKPRDISQAAATAAAEPRPHLDGVYLPQPILSSYKRYLRKHPDPKPGLPPKYSHDSESDDEGVPEIDRDARLAQSRSGTPATLRRDIEEDMTSGDESDSEDLTDRESSDSDWSDLDDSQNLPMLRYYGRYVRHYIGRNLKSPAAWKGSPFILTRANSTSRSSSSHAPYLNESKSVSMISDNEVSSTVFRLVSHHGYEIKLTPLVISAWPHFEKDMEAVSISPELHIDAMIARYVSNFNPSHEDSPRRTIFDLRIPSARIRLLQHLEIPKHASDNIKDTLESHLGPSHGSVAEFELHLGGAHISGLFKRKNKALCASFGELSVTLDTAARSIADQPMMSLLLSSCSANLVRDNAEVGAGEIQFKLAHTGPEYLLAIGEALVQHGNQVKGIIQRRKAQSPGVIRAMVAYAIRSSIDEEAIDPLSAIQPLYLVQSGLPHQLRTDTAFRFAFHLRNCLWHHFERTQSHPRNLPDISLDQLQPLAKARLAILEPDAYIGDLHHLIPKLGYMEDVRLYPTNRIFGYVTARIEMLRIIILDPSGGPSPSGEFSTADVSIRVRLKVQDFQVNLPAHIRTTSQVSLSQRGTPPVIRKLSVALSVGETNLIVFSHLLRFVQEVLRVRRLHLLRAPPTKLVVSKPQSSEEINATNFDFLLSVSNFRAQAVAENLIFEVGSLGFQSSSSLFIRHQGTQDEPTSHSSTFQHIFLRARSPADLSGQNDQDILAALTLDNVRFNAALRQERTVITKIRTVIGTDTFHFRVPRSALRLYRFVEEWRADFLPEIRATVKSLLLELEQTPMKPPASPKQRRNPSFQLHTQVNSFGIFLQVMHGTWLTWEVNDTLLHLDSSRIATQAFQMQMSSQTFGISPSDAKVSGAQARIKLKLPCISVSGSHDGANVRAIALIEFLELKVKPSHWDTLLIVQQKFGQDFNDLVALVQSTKEKRTSPAPQPSTKAGKGLYTSVVLKMRGFRIGLEGHLSTVFFECLDINGTMNNSLTRTWSLTLSDLALSLASRNGLEPQRSTFIRQQRSAFVTIDLNVTGSASSRSTNDVLHARITKVHAVMQPSSIGEVGDFIDQILSEMLERKEQRAKELAAFKLKTQSILKTFETKIKTTETDDPTSWLNHYVIDLSIHNIGVAFPLTLSQDLQLPKSGSQDCEAVRAFLFSIKSLQFSTQRGETGEATMSDFSFQFVSQFRQSVSTDFSGESHQTRNRLVYPYMKAQLRTAGSPAARQVYVKADVSGFILDLDSTIPDYVFSLVDVYRRGQARVARLSSAVPRTPSIRPEPEMRSPSPAPQPQPNLPKSNFFASMTFLSGKVRTYSEAASHLSRSSSFSQSIQDLSDEQILETGAEVFNLPVVSVWAEYRTSPPSHDSEVLAPSILMFKSTVHSSQNTLRPTLLPFFTEIVTRVENRLQTDSRSFQPPPTAALNQSLAPPSISSPEVQTESRSSLQISFSLRIDQSKLELTCQPDVNVIAGLHWDSGGFAVNISPGARKVSFTGSVGGLTLGLKHGFLSEDCVKLDARNLAFSLTFAKLDDNQVGKSISFVSIVLDTELLGAVKFSRLQDILCFKAVWLDHIPMLHGDHSVEASPVTPTVNNVAGARRPQDFTNVILVRLRQIKLDVDLGQSITAIVLDVKDAVLRTKMTHEFNELSLWVGEVALVGTGNLAGSLDVANCLFETIRRRDAQSTDIMGRNRMLELRMTSGALTAVIESDHQRLLNYSAEPIEIEILDDWSMTTTGPSKDHPLHLSFTVRSPEILAVATVGTIPKLLLYASKFEANLNAQREGASRESQTFRASRAPKPENPLSAVAEAMLLSARSRFKEDTGLTYVIRQHMSLRLDLLQLIVFPRNMGDSEMAQFVGRNVRAELNRLVQSDFDPAKRNIRLSFSSMVISKFTQLGQSLPSSPPVTLDRKEWLNSLLKDSTEANIVGLPSMTMHMESEEIFEEQGKALLYDFNSQFVRNSGNQEYGDDIYITLNVGLYQWLIVLRKTLTREMEQVKAASDLRNSSVIASSVIASRRRTALDPLQIDNSGRSSSMPRGYPSIMSPALRSAASIGSSTFTPQSAARWPASPAMTEEPEGMATPQASTPVAQAKQSRNALIYRPRNRHIERLTMRQLGEATPDVMHPFFMKKAGFSLEDSLPQYVNEYATAPLEEIMEVLLKVYSKQLTARTASTEDSI
ncbi:hypothetical protein C8J56DRAFT_337033 [Mycena floridula]|nr:hypothetical protein C8J56DRAFT_337033 [Mycena floridula]